MNLESLRSLQKRIREATGPDRNLDWDIREAFYPGRMGQAPLFTLDPDGLGPCVALMREVLPGREWSRDSAWCFWIWEQISKNAWGAKKRIDGGPYRLANDCLTFLDAIFSAAIAQEEAKHTEKAG